MPRVSYPFFVLLQCRESAATLEAESGYTMEAQEVSNFRRYIMEGSWSNAEDSLTLLGVNGPDGLWVSIYFNLLCSSTYYIFVIRKQSFSLASRSIWSF